MSRWRIVASSGATNHKRIGNSLRQHLFCFLAYKVRYWMGKAAAGSIAKLLRLFGRIEMESSEMAVDERARDGRVPAAREAWRGPVLEATPASSSWTWKRIRSGAGFFASPSSIVR